nr:DNA helicase [Tanacetum cinerariifolium]
MEEKSYDKDELAQEVNVLKPKLNAGQRQIYNRVIEAAIEDQQALIFVYDHGGTGKTFLWKVLISSLRSKDKAFGGKLVVLGGNFRQTLPLKKGGCKAEI